MNWFRIPGIVHEGEGGEEAAGEGEADVADPVDPVPVEQHRPQSLNPSRPDTHKKDKDRLLRKIDNLHLYEGLLFTNQDEYDIKCIKYIAEQKN